MTRPPFARAAALFLGIVPLLVLAGCAQNRSKADTQYVARDVSTLYNSAKERLDQGNYEIAALLFDEVERQHPYSIWARRAQLMGAFSYYLDGDYQKAIDSAQSFLSIHPGNRDAPYAYYLIALCYYEQIGDVTRDQKITDQAHDALSELIRRYPESRYAADARLKLDLVSDHLAGKEMEVGRFYERRRQWIAAALRFRKVIDNFQSSTHTPEALQRLVESYLSLGLEEEARRAAAVLGANYPDSVWFERAYELMREHAPELVSRQAAAPAIGPASAPVPIARPTALVSTAPEPVVAPAAKPEKKAKAEKAAKPARQESCGRGGIFHRRKCEPAETPPTA
jgi:outer membrane protein assembly factor BamD